MDYDLKLTRTHPLEITDMLQVNGSMGGNTVSDVSTLPYTTQVGTGAHFVAIYPDFLGATVQPPPLFSIYY